MRTTGRQAPAEMSAPVRTRLPGAVRSNVRGRSAGARARAETPVRRVVHRAVREPVDGEAGTGEARRVAEPSRGDARSRRRRPGRARRASRRARRAAPARGGQGGHRHNAVEPSHERVVPAAAGSAASRRANEVRSDRRERRREGYPPEGPRPRSGLGRVARSRSDAPRLIDHITALPSIIGTIGDIGICTIARIVVTACSIMVVDTTTVIVIGVVTVMWRVSSPGASTR